MASKCLFIKPDDTHCQAHAMQGETYCFSHSPLKKAEHRAAASKGGQQLRKPRVNPDEIAVTSATDISKLLNRCINELRQGKLTPKEANAIGYLSRILLDALDASTTEERLGRIEHALLLRQENI